MVISVAALPVAAVRWLVVAVAWWRVAPADAAALRGRAGAALAGAWVCLALLLPALFAWTWADRVEWLVF